MQSTERLQVLGPVAGQPAVGALTDPKAIDERLDQVGFLLDAPDTRDYLRDVLKALPILNGHYRASVLAEVAREILRDPRWIGAGDGTPRLLVAEADAPTGLTEVRVDLGRHEELIDCLCQALDDDLPLLARDGGFIRAGFDPILTNFASCVTRVSA